MAIDFKAAATRVQRNRRRADFNKRQPSRLPKAVGSWRTTQSPFAPAGKKGTKNIPADPDTGMPITNRKRGPLTTDNPLTRKNINKAVKTKKASKPSAPKAAPRATTPSNVRAGNDRGGSGSATTTTTTASASTSPAAGGSKKKGKPSGAKPTGSATTTPTTPSVTPEIDEIGGYYAAAGRQLDRQQQIIDAQRLAKMEDQRAFDEWAAKQRATAADTLKAQFEKSAADAQTARQQSLSTIENYAGEAMRAAGGNPDIVGQSGAQAVAQSYGFQQDAQGKANAAGAFNQAALTERNSAQSEADRARAANAVASYNAAQLQGTNKITDLRGQMALQEIKDRMTKKEQDRQYELNKVAADYLNQKNETELGIKKYNAETDRMKVLTNADIQRSALALKQQVAQGTISYQQAMIQIRKDANKLAGTKAEKDRAARVAIAKMKSGGSAVSSPADASKGFDNWWKNSGLKVTSGTAARNVASQAINALAGYGQGLTVEQATAILSARLGSVISDPRMRREIANNPAFR